MSERLESHIIPVEAKMVLIGGGSYRKSAKSLFEVGLDLSGKEKPNVLVIATPQSKQPDFRKKVDGLNEMIGKEIGTNVDVLHNFGETPDKKTMQEKFNKSDVIYISGGNTRHAMDLWKKHGIDTMLSNAMQQGKVMSGQSAGALAWFREGMSDSNLFDYAEGTPWDFTTVKGMGQIDTLATPHFNSTKTPDGRLRSEYFKELLSDRSSDNFIEYGLGIDNNAALVALNGLIRVVISKDKVGLHIVGGDRSESELDAPKFNSNKSMDHIAEDGISWQEFYSQLANKSK
jgi:Peptidase E